MTFVRALRIALAASWIVAASLGSAHAAEAEKTPSEKILHQYGDAKKWASQYVYDTKVPAAPALGLVEGAPELSVSSLFGADKSSDVVLTGEKPGLAFAARPFWLSGKSRFVSLDEYRTLDGVQGVYSRSTVSFAAAPKVEDGKTGLGVAFGVSAELLKQADPRRDLVLEDCLKGLGGAYLAKMKQFTDEFSLNAAYLPAAKAEAERLVRATKVADLEGDNPDALIAGINAASSMDQIQLPLPLAVQEPFIAWRKAETSKFEASEAQNGRLTKVEETWKKDNEVCFKRAGLAAENKPSFQVAAGLAAASPEFNTKDLSYAGTSIWAAYRVPLGRYQACANRSLTSVEMKASDDTPRSQQCLPPAGTLTAFVQSTDRGKATVAGAEKKATITQAGLVLSRKARSNDWSVSASAVWVQRDFDEKTLKTQDFTRYGLAYSRKVKEGVWLEASFGETRGMPTDEESYGLVRLTFK